MRIPRRWLLAAGVAAVAARRALKQPYDLQGKVVLISGGARGLGLALAREFVSRGARVSLLSRTAAELEEAVRDIQARGGEALAVVADVTSETQLEQAVQDTVAHFDRLDVVVNNAGIIQTGPLGNMTNEDFQRIMEVNAFGALRLTRAALPQLRRQQGRVLIVSSVGGKVAVPHLAPYSVSKFASYGLGQALRSELAPEGISVTTVLPGLMRTGSARQAEVKGDYEKEYAMFATLDNLPVVSLDAQEAARRIVNALVRGEAEAMIGGPALLMKWAVSLAPELTTDLMSLGARFLPGPTATNEARKGKEVESQVTQQNPIKQRAENEFNQR